MKNRIRCIGYPWHISHQFGLAQLSFIERYDMLLNPYRSWGSRSRPMPDNVQLISHYERGKYDLAILHIDQQTIDEGGNKYEIFTQINKVIDDVPKVVINHMTPYHDELSVDETIDRVKKMVGNIPMIVNSHEAQKQWGWGTPIIHGISDKEFYPLPKEPIVTTFISPGGMERAYNRKFLRDVIYYLREMGVKLQWIGVDRTFGSFEQYREWLGRSLVYFHPAKNSPMPRARTEAMLSGCCIVSTPYHDADTFIKHEENGFLVEENAMQTAELLSSLVTERTQEALEIGRRGRETAREKFNFKRYENDWREFLEKNVL